MYLLVVDLKDFSSAHRLVKGYQGKCNNLHGHSYGLKVVIESDDLDNDDLVLDFGVVRSVCNEWVQDKIDHATLVYEHDQPLLDFVRQQQQKHYVFPGNTSVECLSREIYQHLAKLITDQSEQHQKWFRLQQVELWESRDCGVIYKEGSILAKGQHCGH